MARSDVVEKKALLGENGQNDNSAARRCCMQNKWRHDCAKNWREHVTPWKTTLEKFELLRRDETRRVAVGIDKRSKGERQNDTWQRNSQSVDWAARNI